MQYSAKNQPKLDIPTTTLEKMLDAAALLLSGGALLYASIQFSSLPDQIPMHFNAMGEVDGYGSKYSIFALASLAVVMALGLIYLSGKPEKFNYLVKITEHNAKHEYFRSRFVIRVMNVLISLLFFVTTLEIVQSAENGASGLNSLFWVIVLLVVIAPIAVYLGWPKQQASA